MFLLLSVSAMAQRRGVSGTVVDKQTGETLVGVTVQLLKLDSTFVGGVMTNDSGRFVVPVAQDGRYIVRLSSVGYRDLTQNVSISGHGVRLGLLQMAPDAVLLKEAVVTAQAQKVVVQNDTFVYNANAYRTPEGSTIEELVKRLPGAQVDDNGRITINGKEVSKILIDGKEFMTGDTQTAMKNIPTSVINTVRAYDQRSDLARVTGIDDGQEQTVLDFGMKPGMNRGLMANADVGLGTKNRYSARLFGGYMHGGLRLFGMGNANNVNDRGFGGRGGFGFGRGNNGLNATKMAGLNLNYEIKDTLKVDGSFRWNHSDGDILSRTSTENFISTVGSFGNSRSQQYTRGNSFNFRGRVEWTPDSMTNILFRPQFSYSTSDGLTSESAAAYNEDPFDYVDEPLSEASLAQLAADSIMVNANRRTGISYTQTKSVGGELQWNRKLNSRGRNVTLRADADYSDGKSKSLSTNNVHLYQVLNRLGNDSTYQTNRWNLAPTRNWSYTLQATYSEPLWRATYLQFRYQFQYSYSKSDRSTYDFSNLGEDFFAGAVADYRRWDDYLGRLDNPIDTYLDTDLSRYSVYRNYSHEIEMMFRMIRQKWQLNVGVMAKPQHSRYRQDFQGVSVDTTRSVFNITPTLDFRYRFNKVSNLRVNYRANTTQPTISQLLSITDDSDPLNISTGNPGLKPAFTQTFRLFYNSYFERTKQSVMTFINFQTINNSISNRVTYNEQTGGRLTRPENINGNWTLMSALMFNTPLDSAGYWNVNTFTRFNYNNNVGYVSLQRDASSLKNTTKDMTLSERLAGSYRNNWLEVELNGSLDYRHSRNQLQQTANLDTWAFSYGGSIAVTAPWGTSLSTDLNMNSRRGYTDRSLNTNELVWNAQISQSFLRGKPLVVMLQFYDLLHKQSTLSRSLTASMRTDTEYNAINSYIMLHVNYRLNLFGGFSNMGGGGRGPGGRPGGPRGGRPGGFGGPPRGGFGGPR